MKILLLASWFRRGAGGAYVHLSEIYRRLPYHLVVIGDFQPGDERDDASLGWPIHRVQIGVRRSIGKLNTAVSIARSYREVGRIVDAEKPDVIHAGYYLPWGLYAARLRATRKIPYALFTWGEDLLAARSDRFRSVALRHVVGGAEWLFTNSDFTGELLRDAGARHEKIRTIYGAVDLARFHPAIAAQDVRKRLGLEDRLVLLSVGALRPQQGLERLLGCVARLAPRFPNLHYLIVGRGPHEKVIRRRAHELGVSSRVTLAGYVPDAELPLYYSACDVFAMLHQRVEDSGEEMCFGLVFLEAGACGKPVVASRIGGISHAVRDGLTGFLVDATSEAEADDRLSRLLADAELRERLGLQAHTWIETTFSWEQAARIVSEVYDPA